MTSSKAAAGADLDAVVVGGGVIGLAVARKLAMAGRDVVVLEAETALGMHTSSRNSEVIHAGIYYPTGSLKARLCVLGKEALYEYCQASDVAHDRLGKLIVATRDEEVVTLEKLKAQAEVNGVGDLRWLDRGDVRALEPAVSCVRALFSPSTGIIDSHGLISALRRDAARAGAQVVVGSPVVGGAVHDHGVELEVGGAEPTSIASKIVVNAAGLRAPEVARRIAGVPRATIPESFFAKGHYFVLEGPSPFSHLIYPVPVPGGLGVHVTLDLGRSVRFGPDVSWVEGVDYAFDEGRASSFYGPIRTYYPALADGALKPGYTGIRPKVAPAQSPAMDFVIHGPRDHGVDGLVNLYGIESPGLTASLAVADFVCRLLEI
ncbi:MAG TPA: NAD(P)/FAD-dependent oxidoreductase [Polyangiaceae bacterium]|nr:NAD(P)/FAD-dependent oxidoreductase [Polyangiaceae bacterium]